MIRSFLLFVALLLVVAPAIALADEGDEASWSGSSDFDEGFQPFLAVDYGITTPHFDGAGFDFQSVGLIEFKIGYTSLDTVTVDVVSLDESYIFGSWANSGLASSGGDGSVGGEFSRFGLGNRFGYGYQGESVGLDLYNQNAPTWTKFSAADYDASPPEAQAIFDRYGSSYRFGHVMEAGVKLRFTPGLALSAGAEGAIVYPRYVFWPWLGSMALYSFTQGIVEHFSARIVESTGTAGPIIYFLLKTGVSAGYYFASQSDMNWPFDSETPAGADRKGRQLTALSRGSGDARAGDAIACLLMGD
jgi:hypothetical protein